MRRATCLVLLTVLVATGCGGSSPAGKKLRESVLRQLTLRPSDLPRGFAAFADAREATFELNPILRRDTGRFGRQNGWVVRYRRNGGPQTPGPLTLASGAEAFARASGARDYLRAIEQEDERTAVVTNLRATDVSKIGDETHAVATPGARRGSVRNVIVTWRDGRVVGTLSATGFADRMKTAAVVALARRQEKRMAGVS